MTLLPQRWRRRLSLGGRYLGQAAASALPTERRAGLRHTIARGPDWVRALRPDRSAIADRVPWITFSAYDFLEPLVRPGMRVLEIGTGGSTLFFVDRKTELVTIEHSPEWAAKVAESIPGGSEVVRELHVLEPTPARNGATPDPGDPDSCVSSEEEYAGLSFAEYVEAIDRYPDAHFDLVLVDGRARSSCFKRALPKVRPGGFIVLDDSERKEYERAIALATPDRWRRHDFPGPTPYYEDFIRTSIWERLEA
jgi:predicted O-methyltransferase YrrM